jgi:hypothetical protein
MMLVLLLLFLFRVFAQLIQSIHPISILPPFEAWQSGALPYSILAMSQLLIMVICARIVWRFFAGTVMPSIGKGRVVLALGLLYFGVMLFRLVMGFTLAQNHVWFSAKLPTMFHLVLAAFLILYGHFHYTQYRDLTIEKNGKLT